MEDDREYLEITFNTIDEGITIYDQDLRLVVWNEQYTKMGITPTEDLYRGSSLPDVYRKMARNGVFGEGDPERLAKHHIDSLVNGPLIESEQIVGSTNRLIRINRFRLKNGGVCATFRDITEERKIELQLRQAAKLDALGKLTGGVAHDLNNILAVIVGSLEIAQIDPETSPAQIETALEATERGAQLIRSLLAFSRKQTLEPTITTVAEPLRYLQGMLPPLIGETIKLELIADAGLWLTEIDTSQFESTIMNLVVNAKDAMPSGGMLTIEAQNTRVNEEYARIADIESGQYVCVSVTDSGCGMSTETAEQAIDPFFTTKPAGAGTGLGLSMAHGFARQSNGNLKIYSEVGVGTTVKLYLPRSFSPASSPMHAGSSSKALQLESLSVLVVEDDDALRASVAIQIRSLGCTVLSASSGEEAMKMATWTNFDLLLTDVVMPGINGVELARQAKVQNPELRVVFMSGYTENAIIHQGKLDPGVILLQKPFRRIDVSQAFLKALRESE